MKQDEYTISDRAVEVLDTYRHLQYYRRQRPEEVSKIEFFEQKLHKLRRNYAITRALGRKWEHGLKMNLPTDRDTQVEQIETQFHQYFIPKPGYSYNRSVEPGGAVSDADFHVIQFRKYVLSDAGKAEYKRMGFSEELNALYIGVETDL